MLRFLLGFFLLVTLLPISLLAINPAQDLESRRKGLKDLIDEQFSIRVRSELPFRLATLDIRGRVRATDADMLFVKFLENLGIALPFRNQLADDLTKKIVELGDNTPYSEADSRLNGCAPRRFGLTRQTFVEHCEYQRCL